MRTFHLKVFLLTAMIGFSMAGQVQAQGAEVLNPPSKSAGKKKSKKTKSAKVKFDAGSAETRKERDSRLQRECKGQVNAGVCTGYTR